MYTREIGLERLPKLAKALTSVLPSVEYKKGIHIDVPINYVGALPPREEDIDMFNESIPNFDLFRLPQGQWHLRSYGIKHAAYLSSVDLLTGEQHCLGQAYNFANVFLVALSMASLVFIQWRQVSLPSLTFHGNSFLREKPLHFLYPPGEITLTNTELFPIHIGHLVSAYETHTEMLNWHAKFINCYCKGQMLLTAPSYIDVNFCDEAYLNYFRCLEYLVMDKILERGGNFDNNRLTDAILRMGIPINGETTKKAASSLSNKLNAQRGTAVAHLTRSGLKKEAVLTGQDVYELKTFVDALTVKYVNAKQNAQSTQSPSTHDLGAS